MAASVYATPPPDLSSEDTALSDVSNSSHTNSSNSQTTKTTKRTLTTSILTTPSIINNNTTNNYLQTIGCNNIVSSLDNTVPDPSKKRRKQTTPIRISAGGLENNDLTNTTTTTTTTTSTIITTNTTQPIQQQEQQQQNLPKIFLSNISQLKQTSSIDDSNIQLINNNDKNKDQDQDDLEEDDEENIINDKQQLQQQQQQQTQQNQQQQQQQQVQHQLQIQENGGNITERNFKIFNCIHCGCKFDTELRLEMHYLNEHNNKIFRRDNIINDPNDEQNQSNDISLQVSVKKEPLSDWENNDEKLLNPLGVGVGVGVGVNVGVGVGGSNNSVGGVLNKPDDWLSLSGLPFQFTSEAAAAALSATGYLPQIPLLGVPPMAHYSSVDGLTRSNVPPLRIFNPEAYCDLCNKEFCNKYFLKTHKANKHGIYEPPVSASDIPTTSQLAQMNQMNQVFQLQQQQQLAAQQQQIAQQQQQLSPQLLNQQQHIQQQQQLQLQQHLVEQQERPQSEPQPQMQPQLPLQSHSQSHSPLSPHQLLQQSQLQLQQQQQQQQQQPPLMPPEPAVFCDICFKRFTNIFAMRRHRTKSHEQSIDGHKSDSDSANDNDRLTPFRLPDGFREDFTIEQEDVAFTPQPRKLSPNSSQQARDANFSVEKLKRLGVINTDAFCKLCCKEYCNKYFLRTHKLKRHGILVQSDDNIIKDERPPWHYVQTSPLNLMMGSDQLPQIRRKSIEIEVNQKSRSSDMIEELDMEKQSNSQIDNEIIKITSNDENNLKTESKSPHETPPPSQDSDAISVDLQKLQSMILQLNDLSSPRIVSCNVCGKEMENQYMLHAHMISEHSNLADNNNGVKRSRSSSPTPSTGHIEMCKHCEKEFTNIFSLKQHLFEMHGLHDNSPVREGFITPERPVTGLSMPNTPTQNDRRQTYTITPTSSYCEICNKELCNKYFMKTHMQRMHGIEIENGAQIGGVICNICNKELCSKYFLRVHKHNTHGIVEEGSPLPQPRQNGEQLLSNDINDIYPIETTLKPGETELSNRYYTHYTEVCPICSRRFKNSKWLRTHLMNDHGKAGTDKLREIDARIVLSKPSSPTLKIPNGGFGLTSPETTNLMNKSQLTADNIKEYYCSFCQFSTPYLTLLFIHERCHNQGNSMLNQSESAVSLAKDQQRLFQPSASSSETPTSTPASTPVPITPQELPSNKPESSNVLSELANITQRPAIYALPQETGQMVMQSFLIEETQLNNNNKNDEQDLLTTPTTIITTSTTTTPSSTAETTTITTPSTTATTNSNHQTNRFVPSFIFFPVKERISTPITVSFTLTPA